MPAIAGHPVVAAMSTVVPTFVRSVVVVVLRAAPEYCLRVYAAMITPSLLHVNLLGPEYPSIQL
jgi:hypothetical protein